MFAAFWLLPIARLTLVGASGPEGIAAYAAVITHPAYFRSLVSTLLLSGGVTAAMVKGTGMFRGVPKDAPACVGGVPRSRPPERRAAPVPNRARCRALDAARHREPFAASWNPT